jgi:hypothetical protein
MAVRKRVIVAVALGITVLAVLAWLALSLYDGRVLDTEMRFTKGKADIGPFILQHALACGARPVATKDLPAVGGEWRYSEDQYGVVLRLPRERFTEVQALLRHVFGPPAQEPTDTTGGGKLGWYAAKTIGVGIQFGYDREGTEVIILGPQPTSKSLSGIHEALESTR